MDQAAAGVSDWRHWATQWTLRRDTLYLNHGSFGPPPEPVRRERRRWQQRLDEQPMDFFVRQYEPAWHASRQRLADWIGSDAANLVFASNATAAMNVVAASFPLAAGDQVLLTDHEYGAVSRIWQRACDEQQAELRVARLPMPVEGVEQVVDAIFAEATPRTRLLVVSHITSATAMILPVDAICRRARQAGIAVCIDGPHAPAQVPLDLAALDCDFYTASCHKWLSAPFGSGFLYVAPEHHPRVRTPQLSWGRLLPQHPEHWFDEFIWTGTHDPSAQLTIPAAIDFLQGVGEEAFRARTHELALYARRLLVEFTQLEPLAPESWYGSMAHVPLPEGNAAELQEALWQQHSIEVPIVEFQGRRYIRVSCHLYNDHSHIDRLLDALAALL